MTISWEDFSKIEFRVGTIIDAKVFEQARNPAYLLWVDFGEELGVKKSSAQITAHYEVDALIGKQVLAVVNFPPKQIGPIRSECLVTGLYDQDGEVVLAVPDKPVQNGAKLG
ncbi:tRNA-binding protein [uncultured Umboniibacter sp.]|uniref:tRNA-binding protein n=1 Tax=uncultured Umboniibacter sp. TaxID=1798917 RepID=UPI0034169E6C